MLDEGPRYFRRLLMFLAGLARPHLLGPPVVAVLLSFVAFGLLLLTLVTTIAEVE